MAAADAVLAWLSQHPGFSAARAAFVELRGASMAPLGPGVRVPEDLLEVRNMLEARAKRWTQEGLQKGRQDGEAGLLLRLLERRFGAVSDGVRERVRAADTAMLEEWGFRIIQAATLDDVFGPRPVWAAQLMLDAVPPPRVITRP